jgi:methyl-accepting chemotaxis protein
MRRVSLLLAIAALLPALSPALFYPLENTRKAVVRYVKNAADIVRKDGAASCATFETMQWRSGDYYIFVVGPDDTTLCHPNAALIGKPESAIVNAAGDKVGERIMKAGAGDGKGWVDYLWPRPGQTKEEPKSAYVMGVTGPDGKHYIVGAGGYGLQ